MTDNLQMISLTLSDGTGAYGRPTSVPGQWWMRHVEQPASAYADDGAPPRARRQCEAALAAGWPIGDVIIVEVQP